MKEFKKPSSKLAKTSYWQQHYKAYQQSNLSKYAYCQKHNLIYHQFGYWCRVFEKEVSPPTFSAITIVPSKTASEILCTLEINNSKLLIHDLNTLKALVEYLR